MITPQATAVDQDTASQDTPSFDERAVDPTVPNVARMYDYFLEGKDHWPADRVAAERLLKVAPWVRDAVKDNRAFLRRAVRAVAEAGIRQFIDLGSGLPTQENVHQVAQNFHPGATVVYVDSDPVVLVHARALLQDNASTGVIQADVRNIDSILDHPDVRAVIDFEEPIAVVMVALLHFLANADDPAAIVDTLWEALPPGSLLIFTHACTDGLEESAIEDATAVNTDATATMTARSSSEILALFGDKWTWQEPGLVPVREWRVHSDDRALLPETNANFLGGVAVPRRDHLVYEPPMPALHDLRIALADHELDASIVFRNGQPHLLLDKASMLVQLAGGQLTWWLADPSTPTAAAGQHAADDIDAAAAALSAAVTGAVVSHLNARTRLGEPDMMTDDQRLSIPGWDAATTPAPSPTAPADVGAREFEHACDALRRGTLRFHDLSLDVATDVERASPAQVAGEALAEALNSHDDSATAIPINRWVTAILVCPYLIALTDSTRFVWVQPAEAGAPAKLHATRPLQNATRLLTRERTRIMASRTPSPPI